MEAPSRGQVWSGLVWSIKGDAECMKVHPTALPEQHARCDTAHRKGDKESGTVLEDGGERQRQDASTIYHGAWRRNGKGKEEESGSVL